MHISDDYETTNRTVLEIIQDVIHQVPSINIKSHILQFICRVTVYFLVTVYQTIQIHLFYSYNFLIQVTLSTYVSLDQGHNIGALNYSYTVQLNTISIVVTLVTKNEASEQLRVGVQHQLTALSIQINVNISIDKVVRFGMSILLR